MASGVTPEQVRRLLELPELIRELRKSCERMKAVELPLKHGLYEGGIESVKEAEDLLSERKKVAAAAADDLTAAEAKFGKDKKQIEVLATELEELLKPYDEEIARQEVESRQIEAREFERLKTAMAPLGWTEEECGRAAKRYVEDKVGSLGLETKKEILAKLRRGEDFPGGIPSFWG